VRAAGLYLPTASSEDRRATVTGTPFTATEATSSHRAARRSIPGFEITDHEFDLPLDYGNPQGTSITVFAREVAAPGGTDRPFLVYFQGGPGQESYRPILDPLFPGWLARALPEFRVLFVDERGTGLSTPIGFLPKMSPAEQAEYLTHFRADNIVADAEAIRASLGSPPWSVLGASFGGFIILNYLSHAPDGLREALISGGVPAVRHSLDEIYTHTYRRMIERNRRYYDRYPGDAERVRRIVAWLGSDEVSLPDGSPLTARRFAQLGWNLGMSYGAETLHYILERPFDDPAFTEHVRDALPFASLRSPLYSVLHESCHADGFATRWAAARVRPAEFEDETMFTGEHVFPWMFDECRNLAPLKEAALLLAEHEWGYLYDLDVLSNNVVPTAAAVYSEDPYVDAVFSLETAGLTKSMHVWLTNEFEHNGLRAGSGSPVLDRLIAMARGTV
jgi:pimeloyl-ACP methyl ester carboxylesterase